MHGSSYMLIEQGRSSVLPTASSAGRTFSLCALASCDTAAGPLLHRRRPPGTTLRSLWTPVSPVSAVERHEWESHGSAGAQRSPSWISALRLKSSRASRADLHLRGAGTEPKRMDSVSCSLERERSFSAGSGGHSDWWPASYGKVLNPNLRQKSNILYLQPCPTAKSGGLNLCWWLIWITSLLVQRICAIYTYSRSRFISK